MCNTTGQRFFLFFVVVVVFLFLFSILFMIMSLWTTLSGCLNYKMNAPRIWAATWQNQQNESAPSGDSDQPGHPPSLIRVFAVCMKKHWVLSYPLSAQRRLRSDWADAKADLSLRRVHTHFAGFVMSWLICLSQWLDFCFCSDPLTSKGTSLRAEHC